MILGWVEAAMPGSGRGDIRASELVLPHFRVDAHPPGHKFMSELTVSIETGTAGSFVR